jgi:peptidoglycan/LPS O-acetylase OafA/YrhL
MVSVPNKSSTNEARVLSYMPQLDGLRAIAVLAVIYTHYLPKEYWFFNIYWGSIGVKLFFVLSGFLITSILLESQKGIAGGKQTKSFALRQFYIRRFLRLMPLYYIVLFITVIINIPLARESFIWHLAYLSNVYFSITGDWAGPLSHFWSLCVEGQFYLVWPLVILFLPKRWLLPVIISTILIAPLYRFFGQLAGLNQMAIWVLVPGCLDTLALGSLLAYINSEKEHVEKKILKPSALISISIWMIFLFLNQLGIQFGILDASKDLFLGLFLVWLIDQASIGFKGIIGKFLELKVLIFIGKISYAIYLLHNFIPHVLIRLFSNLNLSVKPSLLWLLSFAITISLATLSWHLIEQPIAKLKKQFQYKISS